MKNNNKTYLRRFRRKRESDRWGTATRGQNQSKKYKSNKNKL